MKPGIYPDMSFEDYEQIDAWNASKLKLAIGKDGQVSMARLRHELDKEKPKKEKDHFRFGSFLHAMRLEPDTCEDLYVGMPDFTDLPELASYKNVKATTKYKQMVKEFHE